MKIYAVKISDISKEKFDKICLLITYEKRSEIERFVRKEDKIRTLIGELLVRSIIIEKLGSGNNKIIFNKNEYGKPYLKDYQNFNFNISHSGYFVVCAIDDKPIGIDIEQIKHIEYEHIAERFFLPNELEHIVKDDTYSKLQKFYEMWTLKESYIKCCGQGLSIPLKSFSIDINGIDNISVVTNNKCNKFSLKLIDIDSDYKMAVCSVNEVVLNSVIMIEQNNLINNFFKLAVE